MPRLEKLTVKNYRSIKEISIKFPTSAPVILIGENNSGKTNIIHALDVLFGEYFPKYIDFEDHDFYMRDLNNRIEISCNVSGFSSRLGQYGDHACKGFKLSTKRGKDNDSGDERNEYFAILDNDSKYRFISNELREELTTILIESSQNLSYQLSYATKYTLLSKITKAFHSKLVLDENRVNELKDLFKQIVDKFDEVESFKNFKNDMMIFAEEFSENLTYKLDVDFSAYDPSNYFKSLQIQLKEEDAIRNIDELGTGQQQLFALSLAYAYAKNFKNENSLIFIVDEPEKHLHPLMQKWFAEKLFDMAENGLQVVIATHSPYFVNLKYLESIYLVKKNDKTTTVSNTDAEKLAEYCQKTNAPKSDNKSIISFYSKNATPLILQGFFAKKVILVEGPTEEMSLPVYFKKQGLELLREGIEIISTGGKGELAKWWRLFTHYKIPVYIIFDNDKNDDEDAKKREDILKTIGVSDSEIGKLITTDDWNINDKFCIFGKNYEETMRKSFSKYSQFEAETKQILGDSKPVVAREVALKLSPENEVGWDKIKELTEKIKKLEIEELLHNDNI